MNNKPELRITNPVQTMRAVRNAITAGHLPDTYVTDGVLKHIERVSGQGPVRASDTDDSPLPVAATPSSPDLLAVWLSEHMYVYREKKDQDGNTQKSEDFPQIAALKRVLASKNWPDVLTLKGIIGAPVLRPDGTLLQDDGYDADTGLYLESKVKIERVPAQPTPEQVSAARQFIVDELLGDFPWKDKSDKANYMASLVTQILRPYLKCLVPLIVITATTPSSGKTILTSASGMLYGQKFLAWPYSDEELQKTIVSALDAPAGVIIFDNVAERTVIESPILAGLLTAETYSARILGTNKARDFPNDRIWIITGNGLLIGGDMSSRVLLIRLDPDMPDPETRTGFTVPNLPQQILNPGFQKKILWNLLVLVADWVNAGRKVAKGPTMRQFTPWLEAVGGFLDHHGIPGFFENHAETRASNEDDDIWFGFLSTWHQLYPGKQFKAVELRKTTASLHDPHTRRDPTDDGCWNGTFLKDGRGHIPNGQKLGLMLKGRVDRWHGPYALRKVADTHSGGYWYRVEKRESAGG